MKTKIESRSSSVDVEKCVAQVGGGRYNMILIASQRLRELKYAARNTPERYVTPIDALKDIENGLVDGQEYLARLA